MDLLAIIGSSMVAAAVTVGAIAGRSTYSQAIDFVEEDLKDKLRRLRLRTDRLRKFLVTWSVLGAAVAACEEVVRAAAAAAPPPPPPAAAANFASRE